MLITIIISSVSFVSILKRDASTSLIVVVSVVSGITKSKQYDALYDKRSVQKLIEVVQYRYKCRDKERKTN